MTTEILIVDDNSTVRRAIRRVLGGVPDFTVCGEAENGKSGIEEARRLHPDAIVLDLSMPVMNGLEAARVLKDLMPSVPILMFTSFTGFSKEALAAGADTVLLKSCCSDELIRTLKTLLSDTAIRQTKSA